MVVGDVLRLLSAKEYTTPKASKAKILNGKKLEKGRGDLQYCTHLGTPVAIFCIERVSRLDGLLVRSHVLPSLLRVFVRLTCAGVIKRMPFPYRSQRSQCGLSIKAFFSRRGLAHWCETGRKG